MRRTTKRFVRVFLVGLLVCSGSAYPEDVTRLDLRIKESRLVIEEMEHMPDTSLPEDLLKKCYGVAIFPSVLKGGFGIGGMYGQGVLLNHDYETDTWSAPMFLSIGGASIGFQIGGSSTDMILVIMNQRGVESLSHGNMTLGGDISVAAGPVGRDATMSTDILLNAAILSYSRSKGLFAGVALKGAIVGPMKSLNRDYYGEDITPNEILFSDKAKPSQEAEELIKTLKKY